MTRSPELADIIRQAIEDRLVDVHTMLPGRIDAYDSATQKADVEPLIKRLQKTVDGEINEELPIITGVPVVFPRAGGYKLTMPVSKGDRCMLVFCERSIETYQTGQGRSGTSEFISQSDPQTFDMHNLSDPVAVLGWYNDAESLSDTDPDGMQLGKDGGAIIHIGPDLVELYEKGGSASQFVALAEKTNQRIADLESAVSSFVGTYNSHGHLDQTSIFPGPPLVNSPPISTANAPSPGDSVAAQEGKGNVMAIDVDNTKATIKADLKTALAAAFSQPEETYDSFAGAIADAIGTALSHIKTDADVTGVTAGSDTVAGGVD